MQRQAGYIQALLRGLQKRCFLSALCSHSPKVEGGATAGAKNRAQARRQGSNSNTRGERDAMSKAELPTCHGSLVDARPERLFRGVLRPRGQTNALRHDASRLAVKTRQKALARKREADSKAPSTFPVASAARSRRAQDVLDQRSNPKTRCQRRPKPRAPESARQASSRRSAARATPDPKKHGRRLRRRPRLS